MVVAGGAVVGSGVGAGAGGDQLTRSVRKYNVACVPEGAGAGVGGTVAGGAVVGVGSDVGTGRLVPGGGSGGVHLIGAVRTTTLGRSSAWLTATPVTPSTQHTMAT